MINAYVVTSVIILGILIYALSTEKNLLKIIILIGLLNYPSMLVFSSAGDEVSGLIVLSITVSLFLPRQEVEVRSKMEEQIENAVDPTAIPQFPTTIPETEE